MPLHGPQLFPDVCIRPGIDLFLKLLIALARQACAEIWLSLDLDPKVTRRITWDFANVSGLVDTSSSDAH